MDFLNKVTNMVGKGIDSIKTQINKAQENAFSAQPQNTNNLPKGVHILGVLENEKENEQEKDQTQNTYSNKYTNFFGIDPNANINSNNTNNNNFNNNQFNINNMNQANQMKLNDKPKNSSSMFDYFQKNANNQNNINNNKYQSFPPIQNNVKNSEPDKEFLSGFDLIHGEKTINWSRCMIKLEKGP